MKEEILRLKNEGKKLSEIQKITGAAMSTIRYHCSPHYKLCSQKRKSKSRLKQNNLLKTQLGNGKCKLCGYNRCLDALDFHHIDENNKIDNVSTLLHTTSFEVALNEAKKCILICSNCHRELHSKNKGIF